MESFSESLIYKKVADNIRANADSINKELGNCKIESKIASSEDKILEFVSLDADQLVKNIPKDDYYDLEEVTKILSMLEPPRQDGKRRLKATKSGSFVSLTPNNSPSVEDVSQQHESTNEISRYLKEIRDVLASIKNSAIGSPDLENIKNCQTSKNTFFVDLVTIFIIFN